MTRVTVKEIDGCRASISLARNALWKIKITTKGPPDRNAQEMKVTHHLTQILRCKKIGQIYCTISRLEYMLRMTLIYSHTYISGV